MDLLVIGSSVAFVSYILASVATLSRLFHPKGPNIVLVLSLGCIAMVAHTLSNGQYLYQQANINFSLPNVVSLVSLLITLLVSLVALIIATLYAFQVAYINYKLKNKNLLAVSHLPPLMQVENQLFLILSIGTLSLLLSQFSGFIFLDDFFARERAHKTVLSLISLLVYMLILWGHFKQGWRGHKVLVLTVIASLLLTLSYFGSRFVKEFIL